MLQDFACRRPENSSLNIINHRRNLTTGSAAKKLLGIIESTDVSLKELRAAYFRAAKRTHPDMKIYGQSTVNGVDEFRRITEAYELLMASREMNGTFEREAHDLISEEEEERYRNACISVLGIPAEIVEESKQNPMFREWLQGNTDGAQWWRMFLANNGGLAQKLRPPAGILEMKKKRRRRRR